MALGDVTGVFSRYFIVGFFLPAFFALAALKLALSDSWIPSQLREDSTGAFLVLGAVGLLVGLLLLGLREPLVNALSGYPFTREGGGLSALLRLLASRPLKRRQQLFSKMASEAKLSPEGKSQERQAGESAAEFNTRRRVEWQLRLRFPSAEDKVLPFWLGNAIRAYEDHARLVWSLETVAVWPSITAFQTEQEGKSQADAETDFFFLLNSSISSVLVGIMMLANAFADMPHPISLVWIYVLPFLIAAVVYHACVGAAQRLGQHVKACIALHRTDFYRHLGVRTPATNEEATKIGAAINRMFLYGAPIPDEFLASDKPTAS